MSEQSIYERLDAATAALGEIVEELGAASYDAIESETLKRVAIAAGVDHTTESNRVITGIGDALQHERDLNRELRRRIAALERSAGVEVDRDEPAATESEFCVHQVPRRGCLRCTGWPPAGAPEPEPAELSPDRPVPMIEQAEPTLTEPAAVTRDAIANADLADRRSATPDRPERPQVERMQYDGSLDTYRSIVEWMKAAGDTCALANEVRYSTPVMIWPAPTGTEVARPGDWIERTDSGFRAERPGRRPPILPSETREARRGFRPGELLDARHVAAPVTEPPQAEPEPEWLTNVRAWAADPLSTGKAFKSTVVKLLAEIDRLAAGVTEPGDDTP